MIVGNINIVKNTILPLNNHIYLETLLLLVVNIVDDPIIPLICAISVDSKQIGIEHMLLNIETTLYQKQVASYVQFLQT
ncbi:hypothetical protein DD606_25970 [Enterobacter cloacae complex sp. GF14B]|nr:hypothetical protein DD606_25970 [Enterobacter cloacae complex sp. GF14B]